MLHAHICDYCAQQTNFFDKTNKTTRKDKILNIGNLEWPNFLDKIGII